MQMEVSLVDVFFYGGWCMIFGKSCPGFFWGTEKLMMFDFCGRVRQTFNLKMLMNLPSAYFD